MRLRPATPLTLFFLVAFVLLLLSTLSTPIIHSIPLGSNGKGTDYGVFGFCDTKLGNCTSIAIGYSTKELNNSGGSASLDNSRHTLSSILVVHPVAALMTFVCFALAAASHLRAPAHSPRYLLVLLILTFPTLLITLLAFLVDILLFIPHLRWGGWIVLAATIIITICSVLTCAMRRTLVSRKARKKRIAENADMNGENLYAIQMEQQQQQQQPQPPQQTFKSPVQHFARAESPPPMPVANGAAVQNRPAQFAVRRTSTDDRTPLNAQEPSPISTSTNGHIIRGNGTQGREGFSDTTMVPSPRLNTGPMGSRNSRRRPGSGPSSPIDYNDPSDPRARRMPPPTRQYSRGAAQGGNMPPYGRGGPQGMPPPGYGRARGGYPPRGPYPPRGFPVRGGYGRGGPQGMPPPGWNGPMRGMARGAMMRGQRGPPPGYPRRRTSDQRDQEGQPLYNNAAPVPMPYGPSSPTGIPRVWSAPGENYDSGTPLLTAGEAPAMDNSYPHTQSPGAVSSPQPYNPTSTSTSTSPYQQIQPNQQRRPSGSNQPRSPSSYNYNGRQPLPGRRSSRGSGQPGSVPSSPIGAVSSPPRFGDGLESPPVRAVELDGATGRPSSPLLGQEDTSIPRAELHAEELGARALEGNHAAGTYLPRNAWQPEPVELGDNSPRSERAQPLIAATTMESPIELPTSPKSPTDSHAIIHHNTTHASSDSYYEDVDARFASDDPPPVPQSLSPRLNLNFNSSLGYRGPPTTDSPLDPASAIAEADASRVENRSPTHSDTSNFTSISQRQINPNWRPPPGQMLVPPHLRGSGRGGGTTAGTDSTVYTGVNPSGRQRTWQEHETLLATNPDFSLGTSPRARGGGASGMFPRPDVGRSRGSGTGSIGRGHQRGASSGGGGRYPDAM